MSLVLLEEILDGAAAGIAAIDPVIVAANPIAGMAAGIAGKVIAVISQAVKDDTAGADLIAQLQTALADEGSKALASDAAEAKARADADAIVAAGSPIVAVSE